MRHSIEWPVNVTSLCLNDEPLARRDPDLLLDDVDAGHHLGDRMLDLEARVRLHEVEAARRVSIRNSNVPALVYCTALAASTTMPPILRRIFSVSAGDGDSSMQLLVPALDRALALAEVHDVAVVVAEDLELDVARRLDVLLDVDVADAERRLGLALRGLERVRQLRRRSHDAHAAAAAAGRRLDDDRVADLLGDLERLLLALDRAVAAGQDRHAGLLHHAARARLVAHQPDDAAGRGR